MHNKVIMQSGVPLLLSTLHRVFNLCATHAVYGVSCTNSGRLSCPSFMGCCSHLAWFSAHDRIHAVIHSQKKMQFVNCRLRNVWEQLQQSVNKKPQMIEENFLEDCLNKWVYDLAFQTYSFSQNRSKLTRCRHQERRYLVLEVERIQCCEECSGVRNEQDNNGNRIVPAIGTPLCTASLTPRLLRLFCACVCASLFSWSFLKKTSS